MKKPEIIFRSNWKNRPPQDGQSFKSKSMTIIGQAVTPEEMARRYVQGFPVPERVYTEHGIQSFRDMSMLDQIDYLRELAATNRASTQAVALAQKEIEKREALRIAKEKEEAIRQSVIEEMRANSQKP